MPSVATQLVYSAVQQPLVLLAVLFGAALALFSIPSVRHRLRSFLERHGSLMAATASVGILAIYVVGIVWYLTLPGFAGEVEPTVASLSWAVQQGAPLYHGLDEAARYSVLYGPMAFLTNGIVLEILGPSILSAKLAGAITALLSLLFLYLSLRGFTGRRVALGYTALTVLFFFVHGPFSYQSRPDPFLVTSVAFGLLAVTRGGRWLSILGLAAALALAVNLKFHAGLYFVPALAWLGARSGWRPVVGSLGLAGGLTLLPFLFFDNISFTNYVQWLREASRHGLDAATFSQTARFLLFFSLPAILFLSPRGRWNAPLHDARPFALGLALCTPVLLVFASKPGAGLNHLLPLLPNFIWISAAALASRRASETDAGWLFSWPRLSLVAAGTVATLAIAGVVELKAVQRLHAQAADGHRITADLDRIVDSYGEEFTIAMASGGEGRNYELEFYRAHLIFRGEPLMLDVIAVMECQRSGRELPEEMYAWLERGEVDMWLVPKGGIPFTKRNWYPPHQPVYPEPFLALVRANFTLAATTDFFDVWIWKDHPLSGDSPDLRPARTPVAVQSSIGHGAP